MTAVTMTHKQRMLAVIARQPVDQLAVHHIQFSAQVAADILGRETYVGGAFLQWREMQALWDGPAAHQEFARRCEHDALAITEACGHDLLRLGYWRWNLRPTKKIDDYTFLFGDPNGAWSKQTYRPDIELLVCENGGPGSTPTPDDDVTEEWLMQQVLEEEQATANYHPGVAADPAMAAAVKRYPDYLLKLGGGAAGTPYVDMGDARHLMAVVLWPELYARLMMARAQRYARDIPRMAAAGLPVNFAGMDFCSKDGPSISPHTFRQVVAPALKLVVDVCHQQGLRFFYGSDGNFWPVADDLFNSIGIDGWYEVDQSAGMDLRKLRERFPHVTLIGNIRVQVLHHGTPDDVERETLACLQVAHDLGGIIVGCSNMMMPGTPPKNIERMLNLIARNR